MPGFARPRTRLPALLALAALSLPAAGRPREAAPPADPAAAAAALRDAALQDGTAWDLLDSLTTDVGPRLAGSDGDARAVAWAVDRMKALGLAKVRAEPVTVPRWLRGEARVEVVLPRPQALAAVSLGGSVGTPPGGVEALVVRAASLEALEALPADAVAGRVVFFDAVMERSPDGRGYGPVARIRSRGPAAAAARGAAGVVMREAGTGAARTPHTGALSTRNGVPPIPAFALAHPDANLLARMLEAGPVRLRLSSTARWDGTAPSANVVGEVPGRDPAAGIVLLGAHLDSWDLGTGAQDDGAGVATVLAVAARLKALPRPPRRTVRVVLFANEEMGLSGGEAYGKAHGKERHAMALECDSGAMPFRGLALRLPAGREALRDALLAVLAPLGLPPLPDEARGGADIGALGEAGVPMADLRTDATAYFDLHHGADDVLESVDPGLLRRHVAAYAAAAFLAAEDPADAGTVPPSAPGR